MGHLLDTAIRCFRAIRVGSIVIAIVTAERWLLKNYSSIKCQLEISPPKSWLSATGGAPQNDFPPQKAFATLKFSKTIEVTIETMVYCFKNNGLLSSSLNFF